jgi:hypothetical protein
MANGENGKGQNSPCRYLTNQLSKDLIEGSPIIERVAGSCAPRISLSYRSQEEATDPRRRSDSDKRRLSQGAARFGTSFSQLAKGS